MSAPVDVRRNLRMVLQHVLICGPDDAVQRAIQETDDAVAELIEAARIVATHQDASISAEWDRLDAALANCGGAS